MTEVSNEQSIINIRKRVNMKRAVFHTHTVKTDESSNEYGTPDWLYNYYSILLGIKPLFDVCASKYNHMTDNYFTKKDDMFTKEVKVDFYMNPFYSEIDKCMEWAWQQHVNNNVNALLCVNAQFGAQWFQKYIWKPWKKNIEERIHDNTVPRKIEVEVHPKRIRFRDKFGNTPIHVGKDGKLQENTAMYYTVFLGWFKRT